MDAYNKSIRLRRKVEGPHLLRGMFESGGVKRSKLMDTM